MAALKTQELLAADIYSEQHVRAIFFLRHVERRGARLMFIFWLPKGIAAAADGSCHSPPLKYIFLNFDFDFEVKSKGECGRGG